MKFDKDWQDGFKMFACIWGIILTMLSISFCIMLIIVSSDSISRDITLKNIAKWESKGCYIISVKNDYPIYKCEVKNETRTSDATNLFN